MRQRREPRQVRDMFQQGPITVRLVKHSEQPVANEWEELHQGTQQFHGKLLVRVADDSQSK
jgi:hypothetical protein